MSVRPVFAEFRFSFCEVFLLKIKTTQFVFFNTTFVDIVSSHK